jgi:hypothetical protein
MCKAQAGRECYPACRDGLHPPEVRWQGQCTAMIACIDLAVDVLSRPA